MSRRRPFPVSVALGITLLCLTLLPAGCSKAYVPVLDLKISAGDWKDYNRSLEVIAERQTPEERVEFGKALQELKYHAMSGEGEAPGPGVNASVRDQVAGLAVRQVLVTGLSIRLGRKQEQQKALLRSIMMNHRLRTKPGDEASAAFLESTHANQAKQLAGLREEISLLTRRIDELRSGPPGSSEPIVPGDKLDEQPEFKRPPPPDKRKTAQVPAGRV